MNRPLAFATALLFAGGCGEALPDGIDHSLDASQRDVTGLGSEILMEFRALTSLLTPGLLAYVIVVIVAALIVRRAIGVGIKLVWRFGRDASRRLARVKGFVDLAVIGLALVLALRPLLVTVPLILSIVLSIAGLIAAIALPEWIQNLVAGLSLTMRANFREGDQIEVGDAAGSVDRVGLLRTRLQAADGVRISLPNRDTLRLAVRVGGELSASPVNVDVPPPLAEDARARERVHRLARLSPFRRAGTTTRMQRRERAVVLTLQTWSTNDTALVARALQSTLAEVADSSER